MTSVRQPSPSPSQLPPVPASPTYSYASTAVLPSSASIASTAGHNLPSSMSTYTLPLPPPPPPPAHAVLTKSDLASSQAAYADLLSTAKAYRLALASLSSAASAFGSALESCARLKEARADCISLRGSGGSGGGSVGGGGGGGGHTAPGSGAAGPVPAVPGTGHSACTADSLLAAAGVHHLVANHEQILSETVYRSFEVPLLHELDKWRGAVEDEEARYLAAVRRQSADVRRLERDGVRLHRQRGPRDVARFRAHLVELTARLDGLTVLRAEHATSLLRESQDTSVKILEASCSLVRAEVDIFESLARKGWSGGGLDDILERGTDLFAAEEGAGGIGMGVGMGGSGGGGGGTGADEAGAKLFSILPPKSILADAASETGVLLLHHHHHQGGAVTAAAAMDRGRGHQRADSLGVVSEEPYQSLTGAVVTSSTSPERRGRRDLEDAASIFSSSDFSPTAPAAPRPRMMRPFSPQPVRVRAEDVLGEEQEEEEEEEEEEEDQEQRRQRGDEDESESDDEDGPMSPETIRDGDGGRGDLALSLPDDEHPWDDEGKRMSSAASDPDERERRWNTNE